MTQNQNEIQIEEKELKSENSLIEDENSKEQLELHQKLKNHIFNNKNEETIYKFIETSGIDINFFNNDFNPLLFALKTYQNNEKTLIKYAKILNDCGVNYNMVGSENNIPILFEILKTETNSCYKLLKLAEENGANMYQLDEQKRNLLMYAVEIKTNYKIIKYLYSLNYNMTSQDINGNTVYMYATANYNFNSPNKVLPFLLKNFIYSNEVIITLILMGKHKKPATEKIIATAIRNNNDLINIKNNEGDNAFFIAIKKRCQSNILSYFIQLGSRINNVDKNGFSPLMIALENKNYKGLEYLLHFDPDLNLKNNDNDTILTMAAKKNDLYIVKLLLNFCEIKDQATGNEKKKFNSNFRTKILDNSSTEDEKSIDNLSYDNIKNLKINEQNNEGDTALSIAIKNENKDMVYNLISCGADPTILNNKKENALINAVQSNNDKIIDLILSIQSDVNGVNENHETALIIATRNGKADIVSKLLEKNADVNIMDKDSNTPLIIAIQVGNKNIVNQLLEKNVDLSIRDKDLNTPLMIAASKSENYSIVENLLKNQSKDTLYFKNSNGRTAFLISIENNCLEIAKLLLANGASLTDTDPKKNNALMIASKLGYDEIVWYLTQNQNIDVNLQNKNLNTALIKASKYSKNLNIIKCIAINKVDFEIKNKKGNTALIVAALNKNHDIVRALIHNGANTECYNDEGITPLIAACQNNDISTATYIIETGNAKVTYDYLTPREKMDECFIEAVENGRYNIVKLLLKHDIIIDISNQNGNFHKLLAALVTASNKGKANIINEIFSKPQFTAELLEEFRKTDVLVVACRNKNIRMVELLLKLKIDVNAKDHHGNTALIEASQYQYFYKYIKELINRKADVNVVNDEGVSALLRSCNIIYSSKLFKYLVEKGADIYVSDLYGNNALMYACSNEDNNKIKYLIRKKINVNAQNNDGNTVLMLSARAGKVNIVKYLLKHNADVNILNNKNQNALVVAVLESYEQDFVDPDNISIIKMLITKRADPNVPIDEVGNSILMYLIMKNDKNMIMFFTKMYFRKIDFNHKNNLGHNAFTYALKYNNTKFIDFLVLTLKVDIFQEDDYGNDMIMYSTCSTNHDYFKNFVKNIHGNLINKCNHNRETYLIMASKINNEKIIDILLEKEVDIDHQDSQGNTALHFAALQGNTVTMEKLIKKNANLEIQNYKNETPMMVACRYKQKEAIKVLMDHGVNTLFVDHLIYKNHKNIDSKQNQNQYIDKMIEYYQNICENVPENYMSTTSLIQRMKPFYKPVLVKDRYEKVVEEVIKEGIEDFVDFFVDTLKGN